MLTEFNRICESEIFPSKLTGDYLEMTLSDIITQMTRKLYQVTGMSVHMSNMVS